MEKLKENKMQDTGTQVRAWFGLISKQDAWIIINACEKGLVAGLLRWEDVGLSKKQYYTRLEQLKEANLIYKDNETYLLTELGKEVIAKVKEVSEIAKNRDSMEALQILRTSGMDKEKVENISKKLRA